MQGTNVSFPPQAIVAIICAGAIVAGWIGPWTKWGNTLEFAGSPGRYTLILGVVAVLMNTQRLRVRNPANRLVLTWMAVGSMAMAALIGVDSVVVLGTDASWGLVVLCAGAVSGAFTLLLDALNIRIAQP